MKQIKHERDDVAPAPLKRGRGRPAKSDSMTGAERQKAHRERMRAAGKLSVTFELDSSVADALRAFGLDKDETLSQIASRLLAERLLPDR